MSILGHEFKEIHEAIIDAYPSVSDLAIMVRVELEENLDKITIGKNLNEMVYELITWAESTGRTQELIQGAWKHNSGNPKLCNLLTLQLGENDIESISPNQSVRSPFRQQVQRKISSHSVPAANLEPSQLNRGCYFTYGSMSISVVAATIIGIMIFSYAVGESIPQTISRFRISAIRTRIAEMSQPAENQPTAFVITPVPPTTLESTVLPPSTATAPNVPVPTANSGSSIELNNDPKAIINVGQGNLRAGPGTDYDIIDLLDTETELEITGANSDYTWWQVNVDGKSGWVANSIVTASNTLDIDVVTDIEPLPERTATPAVATAGLFESEYIFGLYGAGGEDLMLDANRPGWVVLGEAIGHDVNDHSGKDFSTWSNQRLGVIVILVNGYYPGGTLPSQQYYADFATRCGNYVRNSRGARIWVIGNEMNYAIEWPNNQMILPSDYADAFRQCRNNIHSIDGHENDQVVVGAIAPWDNHASYAGNERGDWVTYFSDVLKLLGPTEADGISIETFTHGADPSLIQSDEKMVPPFADRHFHFRAYQDFMNAIPTNMRHLPVYITAVNQDVAWVDRNTQWVQQAYGEIDFWNKQSGNQKIRVMALYRWPPFDKWLIQGKQGVIDDFKAAMHNDYKWTD